MKKISRWLLLFIMVFNLTGCSGTSSDTTPIKITDLDISIEEEINDGDREMMCWFTNDSKYTITYLQIRMKLKDGITKADLEKYDYDEDYPEDWDVDYVFMDAEFGDDDAYEDGDEDVVLVKPGETSGKEGLRRNNIYYVRDITEYENMEPDIMTIQYLDKDDNEHRIYYNYKTQKYNEESNEDD
ncbi:hypothetical protein [Porcipelethomonas sp.]|uniref:hypothetical protein n=1 Tax=Porcipelethomonas sp. TaxID=2981675 RepID=UPI003EF0CA95